MFITTVKAERKRVGFRFKVLYLGFSRAVPGFIDTLTEELLPVLLMQRHSQIFIAQLSIEINITFRFYIGRILPIVVEDDNRRWFIWYIRVPDVVLERRRLGGNQ